MSLDNNPQDVPYKPISSEAQSPAEVFSSVEASVSDEIREQQKILEGVHGQIQKKKKKRNTIIITLIVVVLLLLGWVFLGRDLLDQIRPSNTGDTTEVTSDTTEKGSIFKKKQQSQDTTYALADGGTMQVDSAGRITKVRDTRGKKYPSDHAYRQDSTRVLKTRDGGSVLVIDRQGKVVDIITEGTDDPVINSDYVRNYGDGTGDIDPPSEITTSDGATLLVSPNGTIIEAQYGTELVSANSIYAQPETKVLTLHTGEVVVVDKMGLVVSETGNVEKLKGARVGVLEDGSYVVVQQNGKATHAVVATGVVSTIDGTNNEALNAVTGLAGKAVAKGGTLVRYEDRSAIVDSNGKVISNVLDINTSNGVTGYLEGVGVTSTRLNDSASPVTQTTQNLILDDGTQIILDGEGNIISATKDGVSVPTDSIYLQEGTRAYTLEGGVVVITNNTGAVVAVAVSGKGVVPTSEDLSQSRIITLEDGALVLVSQDGTVTHSVVSSSGVPITAHTTLLVLSDGVEIFVDAEGNIVSATKDGVPVPVDSIYLQNGTRVLTLHNGVVVVINDQGIIVAVAIEGEGVVASETELLGSQVVALEDGSLVVISREGLVTHAVIATSVGVDSGLHNNVDVLAGLGLSGEVIANKGAQIDRAGTTIISANGLILAKVVPLETSGGIDAFLAGIGSTPLALNLSGGLVKTSTDLFTVGGITPSEEQLSVLFSEILPGNALVPFTGHIALLYAVTFDQVNIVLGTPIPGVEQPLTLIEAIIGKGTRITVENPLKNIENPLNIKEGLETTLNNVGLGGGVDERGNDIIVDNTNEAIKTNVSLAEAIKAGTSGLTMGTHGVDPTTGGIIPLDGVDIEGHIIPNNPEHSITTDERFTTLQGTIVDPSKITVAQAEAMVDFLNQELERLNQSVAFSDEELTILLNEIASAENAIKSLEEEIRISVSIGASDVYIRTLEDQIELLLGQVELMTEEYVVRRGQKVEWESQIITLTSQVDSISKGIGEFWEGITTAEGGIDLKKTNVTLCSEDTNIIIYGGTASLCDAVELVYDGVQDVSKGIRLYRKRYTIIDFLLSLRHVRDRSFGIDLYEGVQIIESGYYFIDITPRGDIVHSVIFPTYEACAVVARGLPCFAVRGIVEEFSAGINPLLFDLSSQGVTYYYLYKTFLAGHTFTLPSLNFPTQQACIQDAIRFLGTSNVVCLTNTSQLGKTVSLASAGIDSGTTYYFFYTTPYGPLPSKSYSDEAVCKRDASRYAGYSVNRCIPRGTVISAGTIDPDTAVQVKDTDLDFLNAATDYTLDDSSPIKGTITTNIQKGQQNGLVPCGRKIDDLSTKDEDETRQCDFQDVILLISKIIQWVMRVLILPVAALLFMYAGFILVTQGGKPESRTQAKAIFKNVVIGVIIILAAWLIVATVLSQLGVPEAYNLLGVK